MTELQAIIDTNIEPVAAKISLYYKGDTLIIFSKEFKITRQNIIKIRIASKL